MLLAKGADRPAVITQERAGFYWAIAIVLGAKLLLLGAMILISSSQPFATETYQSLSVNYHAPEEYGFSTWFTTWDSSHYLFLAEQGYQRELHQSNAFAPLLPTAIRGLSLITGNSIVSGLIITNAASLLACYLFFLFARRHWGEGTALRALILLLAFPTAFFMSMIYTESIFLLLAVASFYYLAEGQGKLAALAAFLLPLTRWIGVLCAVSIAVAGAVKLVSWRVETHRLGTYPLPPRAIFACALAPILGAIVYMLAMAITTGDPLVHIHTTKLYPSDWSLSHAVRPDQLWSNFFIEPLKVHSPLESALDRGFFVFFLLSAPLVYRKVDLPLFVFYLSTGLVPLLGSYMSYMRYLLPAFPLYIAYGEFFAQRHKTMFIAVIGMVLMQFILLGWHVRNLWVA